MEAVNQKPKDPNWVCTFALQKNSEKTEKKHPDLVHPNSEKMNKSGKPFKKNFSLLKYDNVIITPHIAGINTRYKIDQVNLFMNNYKSLINNKKLRYQL